MNYTNEDFLILDRIRNERIKRTLHAQVMEQYYPATGVLNANTRSSASYFPYVDNNNNFNHNYNNSFH